MAANKFATMLHRNTNRITLVLVYAMLEWVLIFLLLVNSLFSYLIIKFADYFGLKRPCIWCSRLDHLLDPKKEKNYYRDLVCEAHAAEISRLRYCSNHRKLAESEDMCEDCSSSSQECSKNFAFFPWMKQFGLVQDGDVGFNCSCCGEILESKLYSPYLLIKPSWGLLDYTQKENLIEEAGTDIIEEGDHSEPRRSDFVGDDVESEQGTEENRGIQIGPDEESDDERRELKVDEEFSCFISSFDCKPRTVDLDEVFATEKDQESVQADDLNPSVDGPSNHHQEVANDESSGIPPKHLEFYIDQDDCHLIPVELMDSATAENQREYKFREEDHGVSGNGDVILDFELSSEALVELAVEERCDSGEKVVLPSVGSSQIKDKSSFAAVESKDLDEEESLLVHEEKADVILDFELSFAAPVELVVEKRCDSGEEMVLPSVSSSQIKDESSFSAVESEDLDEEESLLVHEEKAHLVEEENEQVAITQATKPLPIDADDVLQTAVTEGEMDSDVRQVSDEQNDEIEAEVSIGTEIPDHEPIDDIQPQEVLPSSQSIQEYPANDSARFHVDDNDNGGSKVDEEEIIQFKSITVETSDQTISTHPSLCLEFNEIEEDKAPDTPTSIDSLHHLHKKLLLLERKESGTEESLDVSIISDIEGGDGVLTFEKLKSALKAERKALHTLYAELEEERNASAVATNHTMAMINRLQEEKAAMQMEALQYQRMMDEQSEYDQEALQLLNELMIKREKEKAELEKELEIYRKKVQDYEARQKMMMLRRRRDDSTRSATSSASCSNAEDSDGVSVDLNQDPKDEGNYDNIPQEGSNQNTPEETVLYLEESLADFEEERLSILEQLKVLEEKLVVLNDEEERQFEEHVQHLHEENGNGYTKNSDFGSEVNGVANGHFNGNGKHHQEMKITGPKAKRLLPLFDAADAEIEDWVSNGHANGFDPFSYQNSSAASFERENKKLAIEEEVDHVYDRLQALEADREFLKHCISSLRKGDKGLYLLQEILQHLRDLRSVESRVRTMGDAAI
ncbi:hypothetical protein SLEP1_g11062 [Rubroshorea leprosula]|uniref:GTD-binding domain-containing protein n=1 Tax=Rubroshorea leprosula TaxID=152421 RepID=A0AAV5ILG6_9ROSI|nr:hypothetical protein SLEP1_g11062 [Rubroshorea leprosula]